jgi:hypothetical protein
MNDPTRLHEDQANSLEALLVRAGRDYAPPSARLDRIAAGIASAGAAIAGPSVAAASSAAAGTGLGMKLSGTALVTVFKWLGIGALSGFTLSVTATVIEGDWHSTRSTTPDQPAPAPIETETQRPHAARAELRTEPLAMQPKEAASPPHAEPANERSATRSPLSRSATPGKSSLLDESPTVATETNRQAETVAAGPNPPVEPNVESRAKTTSEVLREEVAALGLAKAALDRGAAQEVLAQVTAYRVRFPRGRLGPEATYLEMEAEVLRGNTRRAQNLAAQLTSVVSPNATRVREVLKGSAR